MALTPKRNRFVEEYLRDLNATRAYRDAGFRGDDNTCAVEGHKLLRDPKVAAAIAKAMEERSKRTKIDADWVLRRLAEEADADIADIYGPDGSLKPIHEWPSVFRKGLVAGVEIEELFEGRGESREQVGKVRKIKLTDRTKIVELIGKHVDVGAFRERADVNVKHSFENLTQEELDAEIAAYERGEANGGAGA